MHNEEQLKRIADKLQLLIRKQEVLLKENDRLKKQAAELKSEVEDRTNRINSLEQTIAVLKTLSGKISETDKKELDKRLNLYLKEIDRCINMLSE